MMMNREMARNFSSQVRRSLEMVQALRECKSCPLLRQTAYTAQQKGW